MPGKLTAFDTDIRVPLIVTGPGVPAGSSTHAMTENVDLARLSPRSAERRSAATATASCRCCSASTRQGGEMPC